ncbi:hypothetical protein MJH12_03410, partial [bacterium]|nr:hypothetical protein [bacterium]
DIIDENDVPVTIKSCVNNMFDYYMNTDIFIGAGGLACSEAVACRLNTILISTYKHQIDRCNHFQDQNWAVYLGHLNFKEEDLRNAINQQQNPNITINFNPQIIAQKLTQAYERKQND